MPYAKRLEALRDRMVRGRLDAFLVPRTDAYGSEFPPPCDERLAWMTGFTGSAGLAVILADAAGVFSDARYTLQMAAELDPTLFEAHDSRSMPAHNWAARHLEPGARIGIHPLLHTTKDLAPWKEEDFVAVHCAANPVDQLWGDARPAEPAAPIVPFDVSLAGRDAQDKIADVAAFTRREGAAAVLVAHSESVCWLLNIRGGDLPYTPVPRCRALVYADGRAVCYVPGLTARGALPPGVDFEDEQALWPTLAAIEGAVLYDPSVTPVAVSDYARDSVEADDPCLAPKARKMEAEQAAIRDAHRRDGLALTRFLAWLARGEGVSSEVHLGHKLEAFRRADPAYRGPSFPTICGFAANGAVVHYRATETSDTVIRGSGLLLIDSGGQYPGGTTDVTRTMAIGTPTPEQRRRYTFVLKAHIALATARFPEGATGVQLDAITRAPLWAQGLDYAHGTGHGVGCALGVHEGPASISPRGMEKIEAGMVLSNEPGHYEPGAYGIRIENLVLVRPSGPDWLELETLTLAPMERALIEPDLLTHTERTWLNAYHGRVFDEFSQDLTEEDKNWLSGQITAL